MSRELARTSPESPGDARRYLLESARATSRRWSEEFESAYEARDCERMFAAHTALVKDRVETAKLTGAYSPAEVRVGVSAEEFARDAAELIKVLGAETSMRILADAPGVAAALEPALRDRVLAERVEPAEDDDDGEPWSNITGPRDGLGAFPGLHPYLGAEGGSTAATAPAAPVGRRDREDEDEDEDDDPDQDEDGERFDPDEFEDVIVEAEIVDPLPPQQRTVEASAVVDGDGVPYGRGGYARRLQRKVPGSGSAARRNPLGSGYNPLAGSVLGRNPMLSGPEPMPGPLPSRG